MDKYNSITLWELQLLYEGVDMTVEINDGQIIALNFEEE